MDEETREAFNILKNEFTQGTEGLVERFDGKLEEQENRLVERFDRKLEEQENRLVERFDRKLDQKIEEVKESFTSEVNRYSEDVKRYVGVLSESFQHKLDLVVEGHQMLNEKLDRYQDETNTRLDRLERRL